MKKIILLLIVGATFTAQAQYRNGQRQGQRQSLQPRTQQKPPKPKFEPEKYLNIITYDIKKTAKKSGVKLSSEQGETFAKILTTHNKSIKDISRINSFTFKSMKKLAENSQTIAQKSGDYSELRNVQKTVDKNFKPIIKTLKEEDKELNLSVKKLLQKKQYKKWIKYNKKLNKSFSE
jgi:Na+/phosphate symporter